MKLTPLQKRAERKGRNQTMVDMNLVSLIDVFTILIFFLLSSAGVEAALPSTKAVRLPLSTAEKAPRETLVLVLSGDEILVDGRRAPRPSPARWCRTACSARPARSHPACPGTSS